MILCFKGELRAATTSSTSINYEVFVSTQNYLSPRKATKLFLHAHVCYFDFEGDCDVATTNFKKEFEKLLPLIQKEIMNDFKGLKAPAGLDYKTIWSHFQKTSAKKIAEIIINKFPSAKITITKTKSGFPDIKVIHEDKVYAIDIKSGASSQDPWYDIARLDTVFKERLERYEEEYDIVIKYDKNSGKVEDVFFEPMYKTVGKDLNSGGVKFRPYDGKLRPKPWEMFEKGEAYWASKEGFIGAVKKSMYYRMRKYIEKYWKELPQNERAKLRRTLCQQKTLKDFDEKRAP